MVAWSNDMSTFVLVHEMWHVLPGMSQSHLFAAPGELAQALSSL